MQRILVRAIALAAMLVGGPGALASAALAHPPPTGLIISYATDPDGVALDGEGDHSPYVEALGRHIMQPGLELDASLRLVLRDTAEATAGLQLPLHQDAASGGFRFFDADGKVADSRAKYALVIGNQAYAHATTLRTPAADARFVAGMFEKAGFDTEIVVDGTLSDIRSSVARLHEKAAGQASGAVVAFFFSGHAFAFDGRNYLVPVDAKLASEASVELEAIGIEQVMAGGFGPNSLALMFLDAGRQNPFASAKPSR